MSDTNGTRSLPRIGEPAPDFKVQTTHGEITFSDWQKDSWVILFSHPADFTPVCSTELTEFARRAEDFTKRNTKLIGVSVDSVHSHLAWIQNLEKITGIRLPYPLIADTKGDVAALYGMLHPKENATFTVRALFVIDPKRTVRAIIYYPLSLGRNVDEVVRVIDALQTAEKHAIATPVNWKPGDKVIVPPPKTVKEVDERLALKDEKLDFYLIKRELAKAGK
ncbi:MAG: peroxiredoxin [Planctomycetes bacterium]|nr:peroxiredoxin [Planctomycetota bacterium]NUQ35864.1 peroxiredoxin [Planctomycetaceae bacterium]